MNCKWPADGHFAAGLVGAEKLLLGLPKAIVAKAEAEQVHQLREAGHVYQGPSHQFF
jgi:hypothetical protein